MLGIGVAVSVFGCSGGGSPPESIQIGLALNGTGDVGVNLTVEGGAGHALTSFNYNLSNGTPADTLTGSIPLPTGDAGAGTYSVPTYEILPVIAATGYTLSVSGASTDGLLTCTGSSGVPFDVTAGDETVVNILVTCTTPNDSGSAELNATLQNCPTFGTLTAIPATTFTMAPGNVSTLYAAAVAPEMSTLTYTFSLVSGSGSLDQQVVAPNNASSSIVFTCPGTAETDTILLTTSDQSGAACPLSISTATLTVTCQPAGPCQNPKIGSGIEASPNTAAGTCPAPDFNSGTLRDAMGNYCCALGA
jgi:hypothetical protein